MDLKPATLHLADGETIPLLIAPAERKTLLECPIPMPFLSHITNGKWSSDLNPDTYLRGVVFENSEAVFSLFDQFGMVADAVVRLSPDEARSLILERLW
jgi:hypothetical protein